MPEVDWDGKTATMFWPYTGKECSVNHAYIRGRYLRPASRRWRDNLALCLKAGLNIKGIKYTPPIKISLYGYFKDKRSTPDLDNLTKLIGDAVEAATGINDRYFQWNLEGSTDDCPQPMIRIRIDDETDQTEHTRG